MLEFREVIDRLQAEVAELKEEAGERGLILAGCEAMIRDLRAERDRLERDWSRLMDRMIADQGEGAGEYRFRFRAPERGGMVGWWSSGTREGAERLFREKWGLDAAPAGEGEGDS